MNSRRTMSAMASTISPMCFRRRPSCVEMYLAAADKVIDAAFRDRAVRERILNPHRRYRSPGIPALQATRAQPAARQGLRSPQRGSGPRTGQAAAHLRHSPRLLRTAPSAGPATHDELTRLLGIVLSAENDGEPPDSAIRTRASGGSGRRLSSSSWIAQDRGSGLIGTIACRITTSIWPRGSPTSSGAACPMRSCFAWPQRGPSPAPSTLRSQVARMLRDPQVPRSGRKLRRPVAANAQAQGVHSRPDPLP